jgi:L-lactate dehydrogenase complex protein LldG
MTESADARREQVLARVRRALGRGSPDEAAVDPARDVAAARVERPRANTIPLRAQLQQPRLGELFDEMVRASQATLERVPSADAVPDAVGRWCAETGVDGEVVVAPESPLGALPWGDPPPARRLVRSGDALSVSTAEAGIAETGTLLVCSGPRNPVTANFLPDNQVIVVRSADLVGAPEDAWMRLRGLGDLPRTVNWITGPSRSGDIEMTMLKGAHGPVRLHVLVVEDG